MSANRQTLDRLTELLAEEAAIGLDSECQAELDRLMTDGAGLGRDEFMTVAGLVQLGFLHGDGPSQQRMPADLRARLKAEGAARLQARLASNDSNVTHLDEQRRPAAAEARVKRRAPLNMLSPSMGGWYLAAALALAFVLLRPDATVDTQGPATLVSIAEQRGVLLQDANTIVLPWAAPDAEGYQAVTGDVVWNTARQQGFLRLAGMPANDSARSQYQLWIVDPARDAEPVDGGVFDVPASTGEVIVPINAKLRVLDPAAFAITAEQPGGVVVSEGPLLVVAANRS
jgi:hypothetical protein